MVFMQRQQIAYLRLVLTPLHTFVFFIFLFENNFESTLKNNEISHKNSNIPFPIHSEVNGYWNIKVVRNNDWNE